MLFSEDVPTWQINTYIIPATTQLMAVITTKKLNFNLLSGFCHVPDGLHLHGSRQRFYNPQTGYKEKEGSNADIRERYKGNQPAHQVGY